MDGIFEKTNFFLESYTPQGLCSFFDELYKSENVRRAYLVTGGISSACSMLIKLVADSAQQRGLCAHRISNALCSHQLDGVYFPQLGVCLSDGGERGIVAPRYPVVTEEICSISECFDSAQLREGSQDMKCLYDERDQLKARASGFMTAAQALLNDSRSIARRYMDSEKVHRYASRLARREFPIRDGRRGREYRRFLSSVTARGVETYSHTLAGLCDRFYIFCDRYGAVNELLMGLVRDYALSAGYDVISCCCAMSLTVEHVIVPELELCFFSDKTYHSSDFIDQRKINYNRFTDVGAMSQYKKRLSFNRRGAEEMLSEAIGLLGAAESIQKRLDFMCFSCMDKAKLSSIADRITDEIISMKK